MKKVEKRSLTEEEKKDLDNQIETKLNEVYLKLTKPKMMEEEFIVDKVNLSDIKNEDDRNYLKKVISVLNAEISKLNPHNDIPIKQILQEKKEKILNYIGGIVKNAKNGQLTQKQKDNLQTKIADIMVQIRKGIELKDSVISQFKNRADCGYVEEKIEFFKTTFNKFLDKYKNDENKRLILNKKQSEIAKIFKYFIQRAKEQPLSEEDKNELDNIIKRKIDEIKLELDKKVINFNKGVIKLELEVSKIKKQEDKNFVVEVIKKINEILFNYNPEKDPSIEKIILEKKDAIEKPIKEILKKAWTRQLVLNEKEVLCQDIKTVLIEIDKNIKKNEKDPTGMNSRDDEGYIRKKIEDIKQTFNTFYSINQNNKEKILIIKNLQKQIDELVKKFIKKGKKEELSEEDKKELEEGIQVKIYVIDKFLKEEDMAFNKKLEEIKNQDDKRYIIKTIEDLNLALFRINPNKEKDIEKSILKTRPKIMETISEVAKKAAEQSLNEEDKEQLKKGIELGLDKIKEGLEKEKIKNENKDDFDKLIDQARKEIFEKFEKYKYLYHSLKDKKWWDEEGNAFLKKVYDEIRKFEIDYRERLSSRQDLTIKELKDAIFGEVTTMFKEFKEKFLNNDLEKLAEKDVEYTKFLLEIRGYILKIRKLIEEKALIQYKPFFNNWLDNVYQTIKKQYEDTLDEAKKPIPYNKDIDKRLIIDVEKNMFSYFKVNYECIVKTFTQNINNKEFSDDDQKNFEEKIMRILKNMIEYNKDLIEKASKKLEDDIKKNQ